jgi:hypothetical protein
VATLEQSLRLYSHRPGTLLALDDYLHQRTSGMIGSLSHLVREAAIDAITTGKEKITKTSLHLITLDQNAEHQHRRRARQPATTAP